MALNMCLWLKHVMLCLFFVVYQFTPASSLLSLSLSLVDLSSSFTTLGMSLSLASCAPQLRAGRHKHTAQHLQKPSGVLVRCLDADLRPG